MDVRIKVMTSSRNKNEISGIFTVGRFQIFNENNVCEAFLTQIPAVRHPVQFLLT